MELLAINYPMILLSMSSSKDFTLMTDQHWYLKVLMNISLDLTCSPPVMISFLQSVFTELTKISAIITIFLKAYVIKINIFTYHKDSRPRIVLEFSKYHKDVLPIETTINWPWIHISKKKIIIKIIIWRRKHQIKVHPGLSFYASSNLNRSTSSNWVGFSIYAQTWDII